MEEADDGGALRAAFAVVVQHPLRHLPGLVRQALPLAERARRLDKLLPARQIEGDDGPRLLPLRHRQTLPEHPRPGQVVVPEFVEPIGGGPDLPRFILHPVEMGLPCIMGPPCIRIFTLGIRLFTHGAPAFAHLSATRQPVGIACQFGGRGERGPELRAGAVLQRRPVFQKPGRRSMKRNDCRLPFFAGLCMVKDLPGCCQRPCRKGGKPGEFSGPLDEICHGPRRRTESCLPPRPAPRPRGAACRIGGPRRRPPAGRQAARGAGRSCRRPRPRAHPAP